MALYEEIGVDRDLMKASAEEIEASMETIQKIRENMHEQIRTLTTSGWTGNASMAFFRAAEKVNGKFDEVHGELVTIQKRLAGSQQLYVKREAESQEATSAIDQSINF